ncbi:hypothetical protein GIB67_036763 [Kingdonia uniflora]|uniref:Rhodanese domain-containing protein n=1 Tax=Kingdonia uniflora TaxID=39325 RepID=A0A7J7LWV5_9MAGN|nr:hypothetical protein GIB67_036763 [Kingdonia uniflora]
MAICVHHQLYTTSLNLNRDKKRKPPHSIAKPCRTRLFISAAVTNTPSARELVQSGVVQAIPAKEANSAMNNEGYVLLDIRPMWEREKAYVTGSLHIPLFVKDEDNGPITWLKKWVHLGYIGLWTGAKFTTFNLNFLKEVETSVPDKKTKLLVACGEGLRSLMAVTRLHKEGYQNIGWLAGGFNRAEDHDFPSIEGVEKLQYAAIGGASYYLLQLLVFLQVVGKKS